MLDARRCYFYISINLYTMLLLNILVTYRNWSDHIILFLVGEILIAKTVFA